MTTFDAAPLAMHRGADELPFVDMGSGSSFKVLQVDEAQGLAVIESIFPAGYVTPTHQHTGQVWGFTFSGAWHYKEYDYVNRAGSFLFEPAGSVHTLESLEADTRAVFVVLGANLNFDADGRVESVTDCASILRSYLAACEAQGYGHPPVIIG